MTVGNLTNTTHVDLVNATMNIVIGSMVNGRSPVTITSGQAHFGSFVCGGIPVGASTATITGGSGYIEWSTNFMYADVFTDVNASGFPTLHGHGFGSGLINIPMNRITLQSGGSFERHLVAVPAFSLWNEALLLALVLSIGGLSIQRRWRTQEA
jgi:hypothetical protein